MARNRGWAMVVASVLLVLLVGVAGCGDDDKKSADDKGQVVRFQKPTEAGPKPFIPKPADVQGTTKVQVGSGPYGGTGSDLVCDRELLISSLKSRPDRLRAWAKVIGISPSFDAVAAYIRKLKPVTLTQDTRVTNHSFAGASATSYQAILQAGTAVLVDEFGVPRARCRCGNPLLEPVYIPTARCYGCPPNYMPPPPCEPFSKCYDDYPDPPPVEGEAATTPTPPPQEPQQTTPEPQQQPAANPSASFSPQSGRVGDTYTLSISGFTPSASVPFVLTRPDGVTENHSIDTGADGSGSFTFNPSGGGDVLGTYTATVTDPRTGAQVQATTQLSE